ncbi:MAG: DUF4190 domain-containing protein [Candidatus Thermoplasmatota archaeon]
MAPLAFIRCPQCKTTIEKPATGKPVCPNCGFGAPKTAKKTTKTASAPAPMAAPATWTPAPVTPAFSSPGEGMMPMQRNSGKAVTAMILGIVACCIGFVPFIGGFLALPCGIAALILGILGVKECNRDPATFKGKGMAVTGIVLGCIMIVLGIVLLILVTVGLEALEDAVCEDDPNSDACKSLRDRSAMVPPSTMAVTSDRLWVAGFAAPGNRPVPA